MHPSQGATVSYFVAHGSLDEEASLLTRLVLAVPLILLPFVDLLVVPLLLLPCVDLLAAALDFLPDDDDMEEVVVVASLSGSA